MILARIPIIIYLFFENLLPFVFFKLFGKASHCEPPKDPNVQYHLQSWALHERVSTKKTFLTYSEAILYFIKQFYIKARL